jgi:hypothetical protein
MRSSIASLILFKPKANNYYMTRFDMRGKITKVTKTRQGQRAWRGLVSQGLELVSQGLELVSKGLELVSQGLELVILKYLGITNYYFKGKMH